MWCSDYIDGRRCYLGPVAMTLVPLPDVLEQGAWFPLVFLAAVPLGCLPRIVASARSHKPCELLREQWHRHEKCPRVHGTRGHRHHQMVTRFSGGSHIGSSSVTSKASWKASILRTIWLQRNSVGEWGSVAIWVRRDSLRCFSRQIRA